MSNYNIQAWSCQQLQYAIYVGTQYGDKYVSDYQAVYDSNACVWAPPSGLPVMPAGYIDPSPNHNDGPAVGGGGGSGGGGTPTPDPHCLPLALAYNTAKSQGNNQLMASIQAQQIQYGCIPNPNPPPVNPPPPPPPVGTPAQCQALQNAYQTAVYLGQTGNAASILAQMKSLACSVQPVKKAASVVQCDILFGALEQCKENGDLVGYNKALAAIYNPAGDGSDAPCSPPDNISDPNWNVPPIQGQKYDSHGVPIPPPPPCTTGPQPASLVDWFLKFPLTGLGQQPLIGTAFAIVGTLGAGVTGYVLVPELMIDNYVRIPVLMGGAYAGLFANGVMSNYALFGDISKYGLVFGSILGVANIGQHAYSSLRTTEENFLTKTLGGKAGEIIYKVAQGPYGFVTDIFFKDKTWGSAGYNNLKCANNCGDPSLNSAERAACKFASRLDIKWHF